MIEFRHPVEHFRIVGQCLEAVGEAFGDIQHSHALPMKFHGDPLLEGRGFPPQVDNDIIDRAVDAMDQFVFRMGRLLKMHAPQRSCLSGEGDAALCNLRIQSLIGKLAFTEGSPKKSPIILQTLNLDDNNSRQFRFMENHSLFPIFVSFFRIRAL